MLTTLRMDLRYACKWLLRSPGFTVVAVLSLGIGIGFNAAVFSFVDAILLRPLPVSHPEQLVDVYTSGSEREPYSTSSYPDFLDLQAGTPVFSGLAGYSPSLAAVKNGDRSRMVLGEVVSGNYFDLLGVRAALGRTLLPDDDKKGAPRVAMLSWQSWVHAYGSDPGVLGRTLLIHAQVYTIVGVAPASFTGSVPVLQPEIWTPIASVADVEPAGRQDVVASPTGTSRLDRRGQRWLFVKGRLRGGETAARATANVQVVMGRLEAEYPKTNAHRAGVAVAGVHIHPDADRLLRPIAIGLMGALGLVLLVACANVANMLLARASGRQKEIGIRLAIGASRGRLIRQLLTESLVLALLGGTAGVTIAGVALRAISAVPLPVPVDLTLDLHVDARAFIFAFVVAAIAGTLAGLVPALRATRVNLVTDLKGEATIAATGRRWTVRDILVVAQTAVTLVLLVGAGLLTRSLARAQHVDIGFQPNGVAALSTELGLVGYDQPRATRLFDRAAERIGALPGVTVVGRAVRQPLALNYNRSTLHFPGREPAGAPGASVATTWIDDGYLACLQIPLARGRNFSPADTIGAPQVAIVNEAFVRRFWPGTDGLGQHFTTIDSGGGSFEVVGVTKDYKVETIGESPTPYLQFALRQRRFTGEVIMARTAGDPLAVLAAMRREILQLEPNAVFLESETMDDEVTAKLLPARLAAQALGIVGLVAMVLAAVGLYGVVAYAVGRRTREIGIRMALGAAPQRVVGMVMRQGLTLVGAGVLIGAVLSGLAARALTAALYGVSAADGVAWTGAIGILLASGAAANYLPAARAARVDPSIALRTQ